MHAEIQAREHHAQGEQGKEYPRPFFTEMEGARKEHTGAHLRVPARKGFVRVEIGGRQHGRIDIQPRHPARRKGTGPRDGRFQKRVHAHRRKGHDHELFAQALVRDPIDQTNEQDEE